MVLFVDVFEYRTWVRDGAAEVVINRQSIGYLGGFTRNKTIQGEDFSQEAVFQKNHLETLKFKQWKKQ